MKIILHSNLVRETNNNLLIYRRNRIYLLIFSIERKYSHVKFILEKYNSYFKLKKKEI